MLRVHGISFRQSTALSNYIRIARPAHWIKNIFVLPGVVVALAIVQPSGAPVGPCLGFRCDLPDCIGELHDK